MLRTVFWPSFHENAISLPESGYSQTSGYSLVLRLVYFSGSVPVLTMWCGYSGPGGMKITSPGPMGSRSPATRSVAWPSRMMNISSCAWWKWYGQVCWPGGMMSTDAPILRAAVPALRCAPRAAYSGSRLQASMVAVLKLRIRRSARVLAVGVGVSLMRR